MDKANSCKHEGPMFAMLSDACVACMSTCACIDCQMHEIMLCDKCAMQNCVGHFVYILLTLRESAGQCDE